MKRVHAALMFVLALGLCARPGVTQTIPHEQGQPVQQEIQQMNNATAINEGHGHTYQLAELATPTIKATSTPPQSREKSSGKRHRAESQANGRQRKIGPAASKMTRVRSGIFSPTSGTGFSAAL